MRRQKYYNNNYLDQAIYEYCNDMKLKIVSGLFPHIPRRTITREILKKRQNIAKKRHGPDHVLSFEMISDLVDWVIGMQSQGYPVTQDIILLKGNEIYQGFNWPT